MKDQTKILLSIPPVVMMLLIPINFFMEWGSWNTFFRMYSIVLVFYLITWSYTVIQLWKDTRKKKSTKWMWTLIPLFFFQPVTALIYLWNIEPMVEVG